MATTFAQSNYVLAFEPVGHIYRLNGEIIPSVTTVLKGVRLIDYSFIPQDVLQAAAKRGQLVHQALQYYAQGTLDEQSIDPAIAGYVAAGIRFHEESRLICANIEQRVFDAYYRYAGTFDLDCIIDRELWLIDYKTGLVLPGHRYQLAGYLNCRRAPLRYRRAALQLQADGGYRLEEFPRADYRRDLDRFLAAIIEYNQLPNQQGEVQ